MEVFELPGVLVDGLKALARHEGATLYMVLLAAFKAMLMRYTGAEDILVGGVTDLRRRPELAPVVGYFLNTMALRSRPHGALPFRDYLAQVRDTVLGALDASEVPFDEVVRALDLPRRAGTHPLFNILFSIEPPVAPFPAGWDLTQMDVVVGAAKFDLYLELDERPDGMIARFLYSTELFGPDTIRRMIGHWTTMLDGIAVAPDTPLDRLPMLSDAETATMLGAWNETVRALPDTSVPALIAAQARAYPDAPAVRMDGASWSYAQLDARADAIAARLGAGGIGRGALVGIALDRSFDMIAGLIAILRVGAAYLPLDPGFPPARLDMIVADAAPAALLTADTVAPPDWPMPRILVDGPVAPPVPPVSIAADDLAYVLYTSGSTGTPKGVEIGHGALANLLLAMRDAPGLAAGEKLLAVTTLSFDIAALELFLPLVAGGTVVLASRAVAADPDALAALIAAERPQVMQATPATWRALVEAGWPGDPGLRILCGGEAMPRALADALLPRCAELWNMYGPTETTIWSLVHKVAPGPQPVPVGRPIANTVLAILDASDNPVPVGVAGELNIGGAGVARGYHGRPDLTAERFRTVAALPGVRLYRTGDLARYAADGTVTCLGRTDAEEKIRGYRVAVEEVEGALVRHPQIAAAAVRGWPDPSGNRALAAYVVLRDPAATPPTIAELRTHLAATLPDYMLPATVDPLPALPMTANAKIDRNALPAPTRIGAVIDAQPPRGADEERLAAIWRDILDVERIARTDSFFDLGGHSLLVARLLRRIERDFSTRVDMAAFFRAHRLDEMAAMLASGDTSDHGGLVPIQPDGDRPPLLWLDAGPTFVALARVIGTDQPMLGVPVDPILARTAMPYRFEDVASDVVAAIRAARPAGPYYIGGWCTSGILAFEVARQLRAAGEDVPLLVLAHAMNPTEFERIGWLGLRIAKLRFHLAQLVRQSRGQRLRYATARASAVLEEMRLSQKRVATGTHGALRAALDTAAYAYAPQPYPGAVALFQPHERVSVLDGVPGWRRVIDGAFEARDIAGGHRSMLEAPHVAEFGARLRTVLVRAQEADAGRG
jgi:amino acid adenylation domain-containing protein